MGVLAAERAGLDHRAPYHQRDGLPWVAQLVAAR